MLIMNTTKFNPKDKLEIYVMDLRQRLTDAKMSAVIDILPTGNVNISKAKLDEPVYHTGPYDERYGGNWYIDFEEVPGKKKGTVETVPVGVNISNPELRNKISKSRSLNYDDWDVVNTLINETADKYEVTFNLKSSTHDIRQGDNWGNW